MENEIWKEIEKLKGRYMISNLGRVRCVKTNNIRKLKKDKDGYHELVIRDGKSYVYLKIHRVVAEAFIPNPDNLPVINHKNEVKWDNRSSNLEWCTVAYNNTYGTRKEKSIGGKAVLQYDLDGRLVAEYRSIRDAGKRNRIDPKSIYRWCEKNGGVGHGYKWYYKLD
jgi:hypothetical protein